MTIDTQTILTTVAAGLLLAIVIGGFNISMRFTKLEAEFRAFRFEVLRFMEKHGEPGD